MKRWIVSLVVLAGLLGLAACAAQEEAKPAPAAPAAPEAILPRKDAWQEEWERVLAAAKREGRVAVMGPAGASHRRALVEPFEKKFGITVEFFGGRGGEQLGRLTAERQAGQYMWDVYIGGSSTPIVNLKPMKALDPTETAFILPEVKDPKNWREGKYPFVDEKDRLVFYMIAQRSESLWVNPNLVQPGAITSHRQLLDPKWKGKITLGDPTTTGAGQGMFQFYYMQPELGPDFIRALVKQDLFITRDLGTQLRWLAEGRYSVCIGCSPADAVPMIRAGAPLAFITPDKIKEAGYIGTSNGALVLMNRAPHPNAAKLYLNWLLSKEGATEFAASAESYVSTRLDVPPPPDRGWAIPTAKDVPTHTEEARLQRDKLEPFIREVLGK